ncbi:hypothetical protein LINPERPRIM_LOCUS32811 [Linum perenne]
MGSWADCEIRNFVL